MSSTLPKRITKWLTEHGATVVQNRRAFPRPELRADRPDEQLFQSYKDALKTFVAQQRNREHIRLVERARQLGYTSYNQKELTVPKLQNFILRREGDIRENRRRQSEEESKEMMNIEVEPEQRVRQRRVYRKEEIRLQGQSIIRTFNVNPRALTAGNIDRMGSYLARFFNEQYRDGLQRFPQGCKVGMNTIFFTSDPMVGNPKQMNGTVLWSPEEITAERVIQQVLTPVLSKHSDDADYKFYLHVIRFSLTAFANRGGCAKRGLLSGSILYKGHYYTLVSPVSTNNNCGIMCFNHYFNLSGKDQPVIGSRGTRQAVGLQNGEMIPLSKLPELLSFFNKLTSKNKGLLVLNEAVQTILDIEGSEEEEPVVIYLKDEHYFYIQFDDKKCPHCGKSYKFKHRCDIVQLSIDNAQKEENPMISIFRFKPEPLFNGSLFEWTGDNLEELLSAPPGSILLSSPENEIEGDDTKQLSALFSALKARDIETKHLTRSNGSFISLQFSNIRLVNLTYFISKFPEGESNQDLFTKLNTFIHGLMSKNISFFFSINQIAYQFWINQDVINRANSYFIERPTGEKYRFMRKAMYGARNKSNNKEFISPFYEDVKSGKMSYNELLSAPREDSYLFLADVNSLYPASMIGFRPSPQAEATKFPYPVGASRWVEPAKDAEKEFKDGKLGFYSISFVPGADAPRESVLPRHHRDTHSRQRVEWSNEAGEGVYCYVDIRNAQRAGYTISFIGKALVYDYTATNLFDNFVNKLYPVKLQGGFNAKVAKSMMNGLFGKFIEKPIETKSKVVSTIAEREDFLGDKDADIDIPLEDDSMLSTVSLTVENKRPAQLGFFDLAYSRTIMNFHMKTINYDFNYTDTDSLHCSTKAHRILKEKGFISTRLGYLDNDLDDDAIVIKETISANKNYSYEWINSKGKIGEKKKGR